MKTMVLSAVADREIHRQVRHQLSERGDRVRWIDLAEAAFGSCIACGGCAKAGRCVLQDDFTGIVAEMATCERVVLLSPIFLGVHHRLMKKAVDRFMPLGGGSFAVRQGEMHHQSRMERPFSMVGLGLLGDDTANDEVDTFKMLIARHAVNLACPCHAALVVRRGGDASADLAGALERTERAQ